MKTLKTYRVRILTITSASLACYLLLILGVALGTPPALRITLSATNQVTLTVTNGVGSGIYEIYYSEFLTPSDQNFTNGDWTLVDSGATGQTNFVLDVSDTYTGFFRAVNTNDFDGDGVVNAQDARPFDSSIGMLHVTIETPQNGSNVQ